jgi:beta-glucosidase
MRLRAYLGNCHQSLMSKSIILAIFAVLIFDRVRANDAPSSALYLDPAQPVDQRVADLVSRLTIEEKAQFLNHKGPMIERFQLRADQWNQCLNGVQWDRPTTLFPICLAMAATWDPNLVHDVATVLSDEARAIYNGWHLDPNAPGEHKGLIYRAPVINIERNPYWGRNHESWGEDPFLVGRMAVAYVKGLQGDDPQHLKIAATLKHFAVNNVETERHSLSATVSERMLREYWLPHFHDAVVEGGAASLMASYNAINGVHNNINHWLLTAVLKNEWRHTGFVVSDLGGVKSIMTDNKVTAADAVAQSLMAGCDFSDQEFEQNIPSAVKSGTLTMERLNDAVRRVARVRMLLGEFDPFSSGRYAQISLTTVNSKAHRAVALKAAQESVVLLTNNGLLPLDKTKLKRIAVIGPLANVVLRNNYNGRISDEAVTALQGIRDRVASPTEVVAAIGCGVGGSPRPVKENSPKASRQPVEAKTGIREAVALSRDCDAVIICVGTDNTVEQENRDRKTLGLTGHQEELVQAVLAANPRTIVVEMSAGPLTVPWLKDHVPAMLQSWWGGEEAGHALADVLFGNVDPAGRLPDTVYASEAQVPPQDEYDVTKGFTYMYVKGAPLFAFGHGLSYTRFAYDNLKLSAENIKTDGTVEISVDVANAGKMAGDEVVQLYVHEVKSPVPRPVKELRGFKRLAFQPGEKRTVKFTLPAEKLAFWDENIHAFRVEQGAFDVMVGASSADIRVGRTLTVTQ